MTEVSQSWRSTWALSCRGGRAFLALLASQALQGEKGWDMEWLRDRTSQEMSLAMAQQKILLQDELPPVTADLRADLQQFCPHQGQEIGVT